MNAQERTDAHLRRRIVELENKVERLTQIAETAPGKRFPREWKLTPKEEAILMGLATFEAVPIEGLCVRADCGVETLRVHISYMRRKIRPYGYAIHNDHGRGYSINDRSRLRAAMVAA